MHQRLTSRPMGGASNWARMSHLTREKNMEHLWFTVKGNHWIKHSQAETMQTVLMLDIWLLAFYQLFWKIAFWKKKERMPPAVLIFTRLKLFRVKDSPWLPFSWTRRCVCCSQHHLLYLDQSGEAETQLHEITERTTGLKKWLFPWGFYLTYLILIGWVLGTMAPKYSPEVRNYNFHSNFSSCPGVLHSLKCFKCMFVS